MFASACLPARSSAVKALVKPVELQMSIFSNKDWLIRTGSDNQDITKFYLSALGGCDRLQMFQLDTSSLKRFMRDCLSLCLTPTGVIKQDAAADDAVLCPGYEEDQDS